MLAAIWIQEEGRGKIGKAQSFQDTFELLVVLGFLWKS